MDRGFYSKELASKVLQIQTKRYYIDVRQNIRMKFFKLSEVEETGRKNKITLDVKCVADFHDQLTEFSEFYSTLGPRSFQGNKKQFSEPLKSKVVKSGDRKLYLDLKENARGRFLKVSLTFASPSPEKQHIVIPAQGMIDMRDALTELLNECGAGDMKDEKKDGDEEEMIGDGRGEKSVAEKEEDDASKVMNCEEQTYKFDVNENKKGTFLKIFEANKNFEKSISIPQDYWDTFLTHLKRATQT